MSEEIQVISLRQLPIIEERLQSVKAEIEQRTGAAMSLACTDENYKDVKKVRTELTKEFTALETQRKQIKTAILAPYESFEKLYKECITVPFGTADAELKEKIDDVENGIKADKEDQVRSYWDELIAANPGTEWLDWHRAGIKVTMSASVKSLKQAAKDYVEHVFKDVTLIGTLSSADEIMVEYKRSLDLPAAAKCVADRQEAILRQKEQAESARKAAEERAAARKATQQAIERQKEQSEGLQSPHLMSPDPEVAPQPAPEQPKLYRAPFVVTATMEQLKLLKNFMEGNGIHYECN